MKIYLAGPCDNKHREYMDNIAKLMRQFKKFEIYCPWKYKVKNAWDMTQEDWAFKVFNTDIEAIKNCDIFFMISFGRASTAGTNFEQGYAYGIGKPCIVVQISLKETSLMTFWGCQAFVGTDDNNYLNEIQEICNTLDETGEFYTNNDCSTILT